MDAFEATAPVIASFQNNCSQGHPNILLSPQDADPGSCQWTKAVSQDFTRALLLRISENKSGAFQATATITTVTTDPLVGMVQHGDGQDANEFYSDVVGWSAVGQASFTWSAPTVTVNIDSSKAVISTTGQPFNGSPIPSSVLLAVSNYNMAGTVEVSTQDRVVAGVPGNARVGKVASESAHSLTVHDVGGGPLQVNLQPNSPQLDSVPPGPAGRAWIGRAASAVWGLLSGFVGALVPAGAWIAMFLASRFGAFGATGRRPMWRHMERILGAVVIAHLVITGCGQIAQTGSTVANALLGYSNHLDSTLVGAGLWNSVEFPPVDGGIILLIVISVAVAGWEPRGDSRDLKYSLPWRRLVIAIVTLATTTAAVAGYAVIADASLPLFSNYVLPSGEIVPTARPPALAVEIPVATVSVLAVLFLATGWTSGAIATGRATRVGWGRGATGMVVLVMSVALMGAGLAAAIALTYGHYSVGGDTPTVPGLSVFIAALVAAGIFVLAAAAARRPWHGASVLHRRYWTVPLAAALAVLATITSDSGYAPTALRWGVVIITGMFMGMALVRLAVMAVGPFPPAGRGIPHPRAVALLATVVAVPWGELGQAGVQVSWWDVQTYADRIDGGSGPGPGGSRRRCPAPDGPAAHSGRGDIGQSAEGRDRRLGRRALG